MDRLTPLEKFDQGGRLTESDIRRLTQDLMKVDEELDENGRWYRTVRTYLRTEDDRYLCVEWQEGLTELQDDLYDEQPYEVTLEEEERLVPVVIRHWNRKDAS